jgi:hypothetical protein
VRLALREFVEHCLARERGGEALHGQHGRGVRGQQVGVEVAGGHGRARQATPILRASRPDVRPSSSPFGAQPFSRQAFEETVGCRLSPLVGRCSGSLVGRGLGA